MPSGWNQPDCAEGFTYCLFIRNLYGANVTRLAWTGFWVTTGLFSLCYWMGVALRIERLGRQAAADPAQGSRRLIDLRESG